MKRPLAVLIFFLLFIPSVLAEDYSTKDAGADMVALGINKALIAVADNMYGAFQNNTVVNSQYGTTRGALYTFITHIPDPYAIPQIKGLFNNFFYLGALFVVIFILGEIFNRNLARAKISESVFGEKDLSTAHFVGGVAMCFIGLFANLIFIFALKIIEALNQFAMSNVMDSIAPDPSNATLYLGMAICDITVSVFFLIRYFLIVIFAVICTPVAIMLVPSFTREFAKKIIDFMIRILLIQPITIIVTSLGIIAIKSLPEVAMMFGYICLTILVALICIFMLIGDFEFMKTGAKKVIQWGMTI
jgi:hypothetical protein